MFLTSTPYDLPLVEIFGPEEIAGLFQNIYAFLFPVMPILMITVAIALAGVLITVFRKLFSFDTLASGGENVTYKNDYKDDKNEKYD